MTKEELIKLSRENLRKSKQGSLCECYDEAFIKGYELSEKQIAELEQQIEKMKCCGNCIHCKYDENEESYEFCEKHQQVVNIAIVPCSEYERR